MVPLWVAPALLSAFCATARTLYIKKHCQNVPADLLVFSTRSTGAFLWILPAWFMPLHIGDPAPFAIALTVTVLFTALATVIQVRVVQRESLSLALPFLGFVPLLMTPWGMALLGEQPSPLAFVGIGGACCGAYLINFQRRASWLAPFSALWRQPGPRWILLVALILSGTATVDKIAIQASTPFTYTWIWMAASTLAMSFVFFRHPPVAVRQALFNRHNAIQTLLWALSFNLYMAAVGLAVQVEGGTSYVKTLQLTQILWTVLLGGLLFREGDLGKRLGAALLILAGAVLVIWEG